MAFVLALSVLALPAAATMRHPLDPLTEEEIDKAVSVIKAQGRATATWHVANITLLPPEKEQVLAWKAGAPIGRKALAVLRVGNATVEAVVDMISESLMSWIEVPGAQSPILSVEWAEAQRRVKAEPRWQEAMRRRGYESFDDIFCESLSAGYFGGDEESGRRLVKMPCYDIASARNNIYSRPIEGLIATVDLDRFEVVEIIDEGVVRGRSASALDEARSNDPSTTERAQESPVPNQPNLQIDRHFLAWKGWSFHLGFDQRFGPVLSLVGFQDGERRRSILYQAHVSEVFVPYMEPSPSWSFRTYMDVGEFGFGTLSSSLRPGRDCPEEAIYRDATLSAPSGHSYRRDRVVCVFEHETAAPAWRHSEALNGSYEGRPARELIVRSIPSVAHYDYVIDWVFLESGVIEVRIGATGIDSVKGVAAESMMDPGAATVSRYGSLVAPGIVAIDHDHFFSIRLDLDIDGHNNRFRRQRLAQVSLPEGNPRRSIWRLKEDPMTEEGALSARDGPQVWRIENPDVTTALGHHPGYQILGQGPVSLLAPEDWPQRRAAFSANNLWITVQRGDELYAAGAYPNQSRGGDGLPAYLDGELITGSDLVAWYTLGFRHVTRPEDWPILPTVWQKVTLKPFGFFTRNPGLN